VLPRLAAEFPNCISLMAAIQPSTRSGARAEVIYGCPSAASLADAAKLGWLQFMYAGLPHDLLSNRASASPGHDEHGRLYGPSIAEHAVV